MEVNRAGALLPLHTPVRFVDLQLSRSRTVSLDPSPNPERGELSSSGDFSEAAQFCAVLSWKPDNLVSIGTLMACLGRNIGGT
jgi:hypothetical protein